MVLCDLDGNGVETFNLTDRAGDIYGTQPINDFTLTYHETLADAQLGTPFIGNPTAYDNLTNPQTIYVRLADNNSICFTLLGEFELQVAMSPVVSQPTPYSLCDDLGQVNDGFTVFDLTTKDDEITGGVAGVGVKYYETLLDAQNDQNQIDPSTSYTNIVNPQTVFIRVTDGNTSCFDTCDTDTSCCF